MNWLKNWWKQRYIHRVDVAPAELATASRINFSHLNDPATWSQPDSGSIPLEVAQALEKKGWNRGFSEGLAQGQLEGRYLTLREIERDLADQGRLPEDFDPDDLARCFTRSLH